MANFERFPKARAVLEKGIADGVAPGFVAGFWMANDPSHIELFAVGERRLKAKGLSSQPMEIDTIFDLASVSKVFATATLAARLVDRGWIDYETPLKAILPSFRMENVQLAHLLSHTAGLPAWAPLYERIRARFPGLPLESVPVSERQKAMRELVLSVDPDRGIEQKAVYSDICFLLLGFALEEVTGLPLDQAVRKFVWEPMDLFEGNRPGPFYRRTNQAAFRARDEKVAATEDCPWRQAVLQGQVHDDNCWSMGGYGGHAGAFGTARDLLLFSKHLLTGRFISRSTLERMWTRVEHPENCERTLGWDTPTGDAPAFGRRFSPRSVGHLGFTGTSLWIDPDQGLAVTLLSNRVHPSRDNIRIRPFRSEFHDALGSDLFD